MLLMKKAVYKIWNLWSFKQKINMITYASKRIHQTVKNNGYILMVGKGISNQVFEVFSVL